MTDEGASPRGPFGEALGLVLAVVAFALATVVPALVTGNLWLALILAGYVGLSIPSMRRVLDGERFLEPRVVVWLGLTLYMLPAFLDYCFFGHQAYMVTSLRGIELLSSLHLCVLASFEAFLLLAGRHVPRPDTGGDAETRARATIETARATTRRAGIVLVVGVALYVAYLYSNVESLSMLFEEKRGERQSAEKGYGLLLSGLYFASVGIAALYWAGCALASSQRQRSIVIRSIAIACALLDLALMLRLGNRFLMMSVIISLAIVHHHTLRPFRLPFVLGAVLAGYFALQLVGMFRGRILDPEWVSDHIGIVTWRHMNPVRGDFGAPARVVSAYVDDPSRLESVELSILEAPLIFLPAPLADALNLDRPPSPGVVFANCYFPRDAAVGGTIGFNMAFEWYLNLGFAGPLIFGGLLAAVVWRLGRSLASNTPSSVLVYAVACPFIPYMNRSDMAGIVKPLVIVCIASFVCMSRNPSPGEIEMRD